MQGTVVRKFEVVCVQLHNDTFEIVVPELPGCTATSASFYDALVAIGFRIREHLANNTEPLAGYRSIDVENEYAEDGYSRNRLSRYTLEIDV